MNTKQRTEDNSQGKVPRSRLTHYLNMYKNYLKDRQYSAAIISTYSRAVSHFARWLNRIHLDVHGIDEATIKKFLDIHVPQCNCAKPVCRNRIHLRAALGHLVVVLRSNAVIAEAAMAVLPVDVELRLYDAHMRDVRGLAPQTRSLYLSIVRKMLCEQFGHRKVVIERIKPVDVRRFIASQSALYSKAASIGNLASALRGYFRFRAFCGDLVHHLIGVVSYPANWQLASLPKALNGAEVDRLLGTLGREGPSARRNDAIVRCALDLGLRSCEIAKLGLDDVDWYASTVTLRTTKSRRDDVLPLPEATGRAIADYLKLERPQTTNRAVFVRHIAPRDQPITPHLVHKAIRQAYEQAGLPYTRSYLLRHTMANRLLEGGSSLKEVADVLRHRLLDTTLIYAKLDSRNLGAVALPWPRSAP